MHMMRFLAGLALLALAGCAGGADTGLLIPIGDDPAAGRVLTILSATSRGEAEGEAKGLMFGGARGSGLSFVAFRIAVPDERKAGELPVNVSRPDPKKHYALLSSQRLSLPEFVARVRQEATARQAGDRRALVFTHGFNTQFDEAVFRFAQIVADTDFRGVPVLFSWPSRGGATDYGYDKDSAIFSRDQFELLLTGLGNEKTLSGIDIFAHSMGNWLTLETLRQASIANNRAALGRLGTIVLAAPDVDMDVFRTQVSRMGALASKFVLYTSKDDQALRLSKFLFGGMRRAGETTDLDEFRRLGIEAHDLSNVPGGLGKNHGKAFNDAETVKGIGSVLSDRSRQPQEGNVLTDSVEAVGKLTRKIVPGIQ